MRVLNFLKGFRPEAWRSQSSARHIFSCLLAAPPQKPRLLKLGSSCASWIAAGSKLTWLALGEDQAARSRKVEQLTAL